MSCELFHVIDDCQVVTKRKGVYGQAKAYRRGDEVFVAKGSGFLRLLRGGGTTDPSTLWLGIEPAPGLKIDAGGRHAPKWEG